MAIAQQLYEGIEIKGQSEGLITYMRTDSTRVSAQALTAVRSLIEQEYGPKYLPSEPNIFRMPKGAQAAHEAIRPSDVRRTPDSLKPYLTSEQCKLYDLIWRRFVASQMTPAVYWATRVEIEAGPGLFVARGRETIFDGYWRVLPPDTEDVVLPALKEGESLVLSELMALQHFTQPPPRYSEASLVKEMERRGIGRPSTYAPTIAVLNKRNYARSQKRVLYPTDLGMVVTKTLVKHFPREVDYDFTSDLEEKLDKIENGKADWRATLEEFYAKFEKDLQRAREKMGTVREEPPAEHELCKKCGKEMAVRFSSKGDMFMGCRGYPECDYTFSIFPKAAEKPPPEHRLCQKCGKKMEVKFDREGDKFLGCSGYPECDNIISLGPKVAEKTVESEHKCTKCGSPMLLKKGRRGRFYLACSGYPKCRNIMGLDKEGKPVELKERVLTRLPCSKCGGQLCFQEQGGGQVLRCRRCSQTQPVVALEEALKATELPETREELCDICNSPMGLRRSKKGYFLGCARYPECKGTRSFESAEMPGPVPTLEKCNKCGQPMLLRWGRYGRFLGCSGFPKCWNTWQIGASTRPCPREGCGGRLVRKVRGEAEKFYGCTRFPGCDYTCEKLPRAKSLRHQKGI